MAVAELRLFGGFELRLADGEVVDLLGQKDRALLAILALPAGATHSRDKLASLLWSDRGEQQARDSLKHALTKLRQCMPSDGQAPIVADRLSAKLDPVTVTIDVADFERLVRDGAPAALERATTLYRGELLDGIGIRDPAFEEWLLVERQRLRHLFEEALTRQLAQSMADGARERAATLARRLMSLDPLREAACRTLMQLHAERGETAQAMKLYEALRDRLHGELGVKPAMETTHLYEAILNRRAAFEPGHVPDRPEAAGASSAPLPLPDKPSIAVLPFENLSNDPEQQYFSDGITKDIITELSRFRSLFVIAYHSSFAFKGKAVRVQDVGRELGVAYVVEGSVRRAADRVRISAQLVDAATGSHLWAERYDRDVLDIFAVQDEVARSVASTVSGRIEVAGRDSIERLSPTALRAYDLVLRAKSLMLKYNRADTQQALACAERAMQLDPTSAAAHAHAAWCHFYNYMAFWTADPGDSLAKAYDVGQRAIALDETESFAHAIMGSVQWFRRNFDQARAEFLEGIERNPNDFLAQRFYGMFLAATGNPEAGIKQIHLAKRLSPFDTKWVPWNTGIACFTARRYEEAITSLKQVRNPINEVHAWLACSFAQAGRLDEAKATLDQFMRVARSDMAVFPGSTLKDWEPYWHAMFEYQYQKDFDHLYEALRKAGMTD
jgi:TolB-like protein/DNA-binding SARP family transcriptional activator